MLPSGDRGGASPGRVEGAIVLIGSIEEIPGTKGDIVVLDWGKEEDRFSVEEGLGG